MKRVFDPTELEWMDQTHTVTAELELDLTNLEKLNRYFGGHRVVRGFLQRWCGQPRAYRVLDLGTGAADIPRMIINWGRRRGAMIRIDAVDSNPAILEIAQRRSRGYPEITFIQCDALTYDSTICYDFVFSSLMLHHFSNEDAVKLLRCARQLSYGKVLMADLERSIFTSAAVFLLTCFLFRNPMTKHDARLSARRAFSYREMEQLARLAGWEDYHHKRSFPARQVLWMAVSEDATVVNLPESALDFAT
jgi:ubiquinone/menaquinone biosynthesis C-methylase UbiE